MATTEMKLTRRSKRDLRLDELCRAMQKSRYALRGYRENRKRMIRLYAGADWSENAEDLKRPLNMIGVYVDLVSRGIVNQSPSVMLSTWDEARQRDIRTAQDWANKQFRKTGLGETLHRWVVDSLFWFGIVKTGIADPVVSERTGFKTWAGEPYAETVDPDDYVCDIFARNFAELSYEGHRYRATTETANRLYRLRGENKLTADQTTYNSDGDERVALMGRGFEAGDKDEYGDWCDLWEVYLPAHRAVLTFRSQQGGAPSGKDDLIYASEYVGPYCGPFVKLGQITVPGNLLPKGPVMDMLALDLAINRNTRKLIRQSARTKELTLYRSSASEDMKRINAASDGDTVQMDHVGEILQQGFSNPNAQLFGLTLQFKQLFSWLGGNLDVLGGLSRQAGTASQEAQMGQNASARLSSMQQVTLNATREVMSNLLWYYWHDPEGVMRAKYKPEGVEGIEFPRLLTPQQRRTIEWDDLDVDVDPYSMSSQTPQQRLAFLNGLVNQIIPILPVIGQQGVQFDAQAWLRKVGEYANQPDVREIFRLGDPLPGQEGGGGPEAAGKPPVTNRTYTRKSESEMTQDGQDSDMIQQLMGSGATGAGDFGGLGE